MEKILKLADIQEICIIDDDAMAIFLAEKILEYEMPGISLKSFENVDDALNFLKANSQTRRLIFVDLNMPKKDGWCFLEEYRGKPDKDIIFILSSSDNINDKNKALRYQHLTAYLEKPLTIELVGDLKNSY